MKYLRNVTENKGAAFLILLDPDKYSSEKMGERIKEYEEFGVDAFLVGGSLMMQNNFQMVIEEIKNTTRLPVIIFPGNSSQLSPYADAVLYISLISGRNPQYLIGEQIISAPIIKDMELEPISTGYILIESGITSAVEVISNTRPLPRDKIEVVLAHALAAQYLGMSYVYLEAGSGAKKSVPEKMIKEVKKHIDIPIITGGGIKTPEEAASKVQAGASVVVVGNKLEEEHSLKIIKQFAEAVHQKNGCNNYG